MYVCVFFFLFVFKSQPWVGARVVVASFAVPFTLNKPPPPFDATDLRRACHGPLLSASRWWTRADSCRFIDTEAEVDEDVSDDDEAELDNDYDRYVQRN